MPAGEQYKTLYPGLIPVEAMMWRLWLHEHELEFEAFQYDLHVGQGVRLRSPALDGMPELQRANTEQYQRATQKKIDVVGFARGETWIFEIEERPGHRALGQLLNYEVLLPRALPGVGSITLALIARYIGPDNLESFEAQGVVVYKVLLPF